MGEELVDFSIIVVNYNNCDLLEQCIQSIKRHTKDVSYEIIVVDNASTECDIENIGKTYKNLIIIKNERNLGFGVANNIGAKRAVGKYLLFVNNDVLFIENTLKVIRDYLSSKDEEIILGCKLLNSDLSHQLSYSRFENFWNLLGISFFLYKLFPKSSIFNKYYIDFSLEKEEYLVDIIKGAFLIISKKSFEKLGGFDEDYFFFGEESDLCYRFKKQIGKVIYYPKTSVIHIGGATATDTSWFKYRFAAIARLKFYWKHYPLYKRYLFYCLHWIGNLNRVIFNLVIGIATLNRVRLIKSKYYFKLLFICHNNDLR